MKESDQNRDQPGPNVESIEEQSGIEKAELKPEDFFDADGALSRAYLLQRGSCCKNGCKNCPYGFNSARVKRTLPG